MSKKKFKETGFGQFCTRIAKDIPGIAGDVTEIILSPNPVTEMVGKIGSLLKKKSLADEKAMIALREFDLKQMEWEKEMHEIEVKAFALEVDDRRSARNAYVERTQEFANEVGRSIIRRNLPMVGILLFFQAFCAISVVVVTLRIIPEKETAVAVGTAIGSTIGTAIGTVVGSLLQERQQVVGFLFGSSLGSKQKSVDM